MPRVGITDIDHQSVCPFESGPFPLTEKGSLVGVAPAVFLDGPVPPSAYTGRAQHAPERRVAAAAGLEGVEIHDEERKREAEGLLRLPRAPPKVVELHSHASVHGGVVRTLFRFFGKAYIRWKRAGQWWTRGERREGKQGCRFMKTYALDVTQSSGVRILGEARPNFHRPDTVGAKNVVKAAERRRNEVGSILGAGGLARCSQLLIILQPCLSILAAVTLRPPAPRNQEQGHLSPGIKAVHYQHVSTLLILASESLTAFFKKRRRKKKN